jgi:hypothetical protein
MTNFGGFKIYTIRYFFFSKRGSPSLYIDQYILRFIILIQGSKFTLFTTSDLYFCYFCTT